MLADQRRKRNIALIVGYIGDNYKGRPLSAIRLHRRKIPDCSVTGLQKQPEGEARTVESELERALYDIGCIRDSNYGHLDKVGWSRSSRTDAGVHSSGTVCSAKLLLADSNQATLVDDLNANLPDDIRVIAFNPVPKRSSSISF